MTKEVKVKTHKWNEKPKRLSRRQILRESRFETPRYEAEVSGSTQVEEIRECARQMLDAARELLDAWEQEQKRMADTFWVKRSPRTLTTHMVKNAI